MQLYRFLTDAVYTEMHVLHQNINQNSTWKGVNHKAKRTRKTMTNTTNTKQYQQHSYTKFSMARDVHLPYRTVIKKTGHKTFFVCCFAKQSLTNIQSGLQWKAKEQVFCSVAIYSIYLDIFVSTSGECLRG